MIWDKQNARTLSNVIDLLIQNKNCQLSVAGDDAILYPLSDPADLDRWESDIPEVFE
jgi:hypothetical protein